MAASKNLSPTERKLRAMSAAHESWARTENRTARSQHGRDAFRRSFANKVDSEHKLSEAERTKRGESAFKAHMARIAFKSAQARRLRNATSTGTTDAPADD